MLCVVVWRSETPGCQLTDDHVTVELVDVSTSRGSVVCMSASASVKCGHSLSFHLHHSGAAAAAGPLMLSEHDGVGLSVTDNVNMDSDDVIFYSFHGNSSFH